MTSLADRLAGARVFDLAHPLHRGMPVSPNHPPFQMAMMRRHGDVVRDDGGSAANELIVTGGHVGTHIDALGHVSQDGLVHGGALATDVQGAAGLSALGIDEAAPILGRGVLLDVASLHGVDRLAADHEVSPAELAAAAGAAGVEIRGGDAVLIRTGWASLWGEPDRFRGVPDGAPGPGPAAARWLADRGVRLAGGETIAFERIPAGEGHRTLPVHRILLVEAGIHIVEVMDLSALAQAAVFEFAIVVAPLRILGATGSPVRPLAIVDG